MKIIILITVLESLALTLWIGTRWLSRNRRSKRPAAPPQLAAAHHGVDVMVSREAAALDASRWAFINAWRPEDQADDRRPIRGVVVDSVRSPSARRSATRRFRQMMYKEWSQTRHD